MIRTVFLLAAAWLLAAAGPFDQPLATSVFDTAFAFIAPRTLEPEGVPQLAVWGLRGITAIDPSLTPELQDGTLRLMQAGRPVFSTPAPAPGDTKGWAAAAAGMAEAASGLSNAVAQAGTAAIIRSFFDELFNHLDPYSRYAPPGAAETDRERRSGQVGLGLTLVRGRPATVATVTPGSPADEAGLRAGDRITAIDGHPTGTTAAPDLEALIAGPEATTVRLTWRGRTGRSQTRDIERAIVPPLTVFAERLGEVLFITITGFSVETDQQFADALQAGLSGHRIRGVVVDLRGNRGGLLRQAVSTADLVMSGGIVATTAGRHPQSSRAWPGGSTGDLAGGRPMVLLVDGRSASAAEIMAAALEDNGRAVVVGSSTLGKGLVQTISPLPDDGELFVTWSRVLAPGGWPIQGLGVMPQVCTSLGEESVRQQLAALQQGTLLLGPALARHDAARAPLPVAQVVELRNACPAAEGRDSDQDVAQFLIDHPAAYRTALTAGIDRTATKP